MDEFEPIYNQYFNLVYKYLLCLTNNHDLSEELTQETFYKAILKIHTFKGNSKITTWLCKIAQNLLFNHIRHNKKIQISNIEDFATLSTLENIEDIIILNEEKRKLYNEIAKLNKTTSLVILYRISGNLSFREIGDIFGKTETWARVTFYRGEKILKEGLL